MVSRVAAGDRNISAESTSHPDEVGEHNLERKHQENTINTETQIIPPLSKELKRAGVAHGSIYGIDVDRPPL